MGMVLKDIDPPVARSIQRFLKENGYPNLVVDGAFGNESSKALAGWQKANNLPVTGDYDALTKEAINAKLLAKVTPVTTSGYQFSITPEQMAKAIGCSLVTANAWAPALNAAMVKWGIKTKEDGCAFIAQCATESGGFSVFVENMNYSADGLANTWRNRFAKTDEQGNYLKMLVKGVERYVPNALAISVAKQPERIANIAYANRMGNGDEKSGDGWRNRGHGPLQITGADNLRKYSQLIGVDLLKDPEQLTKPDVGSMAAAAYWFSNGISKYSAAGDFDGASDLVNIGKKTKAIGDAIGYDKRSEYYNKLLAVT